MKFYDRYIKQAANLKNIKISRLLYFENDIKTETYITIKQITKVYNFKSYTPFRKVGLTFYFHLVHFVINLVLNCTHYFFICHSKCFLEFLRLTALEHYLEF